MAGSTPLFSLLTVCMEKSSGRVMKQPRDGHWQLPSISSFRRFCRGKTIGKHPCPSRCMWKTDGETISSLGAFRYSDALKCQPDFREIICHFNGDIQANIISPDCVSVSSLSFRKYMQSESFQLGPKNVYCELVQCLFPSMRWILRRLVRLKRKILVFSRCECLMWMRHPFFGYFLSKREFIIVLDRISPFPDDIPQTHSVELNSEWLEVEIDMDMDIHGYPRISI